MGVITVFRTPKNLYRPKAGAVMATECIEAELMMKKLAVANTGFWYTPGSKIGIIIVFFTPENPHGSKTGAIRALECLDIRKPNSTTSVQR